MNCDVNQLLCTWFQISINQTECLWLLQLPGLKETTSSSSASTSLTWPCRKSRLTFFPKRFLWFFCKLYPLYVPAGGEGLLVLQGGWRSWEENLWAHHEVPQRSKSRIYIYCCFEILAKNLNMYLYTFRLTQRPSSSKPKDRVLMWLLRRFGQKT